MTVLLTGGAGYIGTHTAAALVQAGHDAVLLDDYSNSRPAAAEHVRALTGADIPACTADVRDTPRLIQILRQYSVDCVVHLAGRKAVGESVARPLDYYRVNLDGMLSVLEAMKISGVSRLVFSSSATVYGTENPVPYRETMPTGRCSSPYGWSKAMAEQICRDAAASDPALSVVILRYFNPVGAHPSGELGEDPLGQPNNLMPRLARVAAGRQAHLTVYGRDYPTPDGTCRRDYLHVMDLALGHVQAVAYAAAHRGTEEFNLGTGQPYSVLELAEAFSRVSGRPIPLETGPRRAGDLPEFWADPDKARRLLSWQARYGLEDMCRHAWLWQSRHPAGYA